MGIIPTITCRRCNRKYSGLRGRCPYCGTTKTEGSSRAPMSTDAATAGTPQRKEYQTSAKWQLIFIAVVLVAVIVSVIVLISVSIGDASVSRESPSPSPSEMVSPSPSPTPTPTPTPTPVPITSMEIYFFSEAKPEFAMRIGEAPVPLRAVWYPTDVADVTVQWSSSNEEVASVTQDGLVSAVGAGNAIITAKVGEVEAKSTVYVAG